MRTSAFWTQYVTDPAAFLRNTEGIVNMIMLDVWWPKEIFTNFDPENLDKQWIPFPYSYRDFISFFRQIHPRVEIVFGLAGDGYSDRPELNFFQEYPAARIDTRWINPDYRDQAWDNKTFLEEYAERLNLFAEIVGIPFIYSFEDWRYPECLITTEKAIFFRSKMQTLNPASKVYVPSPMGFTSSRSATYNWFADDHAIAWEAVGNTDNVIADVLLQNVWDSAKVYHSAMNVPGWLGAQMCVMPKERGMILKLYWGGSGLETNNPRYNIAQMKKRLKDIVLASYLTRVVRPEGEWCPVVGFIIVYKPPPVCTMEDILEVLNFARRMEFLRRVPVHSPILKIPASLGRDTSDPVDPLNGYQVSKGLIPMRFVHEHYVASVPPGELVVEQSKRDYSSDMGIEFSAPLRCTWLITFTADRKYYLIYHDGGYELYDADTSSYLELETIEINGLTLDIPADSVTLWDEKGNPIQEPNPKV